MPHFYRYRGDDEDITARSRTPAPSTTDSRGKLSYQYISASMYINRVERISPPPQTKALDEQWPMQYKKLLQDYIKRKKYLHHCFLNTNFLFFIKIQSMLMGCSWKIETHTQIKLTTTKTFPRRELNPGLLGESQIS